MKKFIGKLFYVGLGTLLSFYFVKLHNNKPLPGNEVDLSMFLSQNEFLTAKDTIKIGDSVGKNLFPLQEKQGQTLNLCCNQAISMLGHLMLIQQCLNKSVLDTFPQIFGYFRPSSFLNNLDQKWTNNYFIKRFYNYDWLFNESICDRREKHIIDNTYLNMHWPYKWFIKKTWNLPLLQPLFYDKAFGNNTKKIVHDKTPNLIDFLIDSQYKRVLRSIQFKSMPIAKSKWNQEITVYNQLIDIGLNISKPILLPDSLFVSDKIHLKSEFRTYVLNKIL